MIPVMARPDQPTGLCILLLPAELESLPQDDTLRDLLRADGVVAVEPPRISYGAQTRIPADLADALATIQARRLLRALREPPVVVVASEPAQYPLARGVLVSGECELWYRTALPRENDPAQPTRRAQRLETLDVQARERSALTFAPQDDRAPLWARLRELGVDVRVSATAASRYAR
jgi:hypothetical protein